jgi:predicted metal-dependent peptidase
MSDASQKISQATTQIILDHPFFATLLLHMPRIEDPSVQTACTNGVVIKYNPKFVDTLTQEEVAGLLVHEVLHPALGHLHRLPANAHGNMAGDYAINNFLDNYNKGVGCNRLKLTDGGLLNHDYDDLSAEQILAKIPPPPPEPPGDGDGEGNGKGKGRSKQDGGWGEFEKPAGTEDVSAEDMQSEWERRLVQSATAVKMQRGTLPSCIEALIDKLVNPVVPWEQVLNRFIDNTSANDYSWAKPDRRFLPDDIIFPDLHDETLGHIVVALDTSGSIYGAPDVLASFETELNGIIQRCKPERVTVIHCDAKVQRVEEFGGNDTIKLKPKGGGGTDFRPIGDYIHKHNINPRVCVYLTDLEGCFPDAPWQFPTIWCVYNNANQEAPFGDTVHIPNPSHN